MSPHVFLQSNVGKAVHSQSTPDARALPCRSDDGCDKIDAIAKGNARGGATPQFGAQGQGKTGPKAG
jgi:hypothetical protein|tara:strand:+ start:38 stop:238 length:201 start_codon:yes stop_codon:yes gene_type:complete